MAFKDLLTTRAVVITLAGVIAATAAACGGGDDDSPTATATTQAPTATTQAATPTATTSSVAGDPEEGEELFTSAGCSACHSTGSNQVVGPGLAGIGERAETRVEGLTADEYIAQSMRQPGAYVVQGFPPVMTSFDYLSDQEIADLTAYLKTLE